MRFVCYVEETSGGGYTLKFDSLLTYTSRTCTT